MAISMISIALFVEDNAHESFVRALLGRLEREYGVSFDVSPRSAMRGGDAVRSEIRQYLTDIRQDRQSLPDLIIIAKDANCQKCATVRRELDAFVNTGLRDLLVYAIPDPHIERWLLLDSRAFKQALGKGCDSPDLKCARDRYKHQLAQAVRNAGARPLLGGIEHTDEIVAHMDLEAVAKSDESFREFLHSLRNRLDLLLE